MKDISFGGTTTGVIGGRSARLGPFSMPTRTANDPVPLAITRMMVTFAPHGTLARETVRSARAGSTATETLSVAVASFAHCAAGAKRMSAPRAVVTECGAAPSPPCTYMRPIERPRRLA